MPSLVAPALAAAVVFTSTGCLAAPAHGASPATSPAGCTAAATRALVHTFVGDFNTGRLRAIDELWAPAPRFQWYSTGGRGSRLGGDAKDRATLIPYLRDRAETHERILLVRLAAGYDARRNIANFGGKLIRSADDITPRLVSGPNGRRPIRHDFKGAADCVSGHLRLIVWSM